MIRRMKAGVFGCCHLESLQAFLLQWQKQLWRRRWWGRSGIVVGELVGADDSNGNAGDDFDSLVVLTVAVVATIWKLECQISDSLL
ncbi:hypothetical protein R6Q57_005198 [Mikania cordata]